jgi:dolichyl-phosphate beta-glucosyltransferase
VKRKNLARRKHATANLENTKIDDAEVFMSVVVPAYNEEERLGGMLEEAVEFLQSTYGDAHGPSVEAEKPSTSATYRRVNGKKSQPENDSTESDVVVPTGRGWEIIIVSDGSTDKTIDIALDFAKDHQLSQYPAPVRGPWKTKPAPTHIPHGSIRVVSLEENRGKGGAVVHGMRHARGEYVVFADADGASNFDDLGKLVRGCRDAEDTAGRGVAIGSRAHLVGSEAVVKVRGFFCSCLKRLSRLTC